MKLPDRAVKYFGNDRWHTDIVGKYRAACLQRSSSLQQHWPALPETLAHHMDDIVDQQDTAVDMIATGGPKTLTRDKAVIETFAWRIAFAEEGKAFARQRGWSGNYFALVEFIAENYPLPLRKDRYPRGRSGLTASAASAIAYGAEEVSGVYDTDGRRSGRVG